MTSTTLPPGPRFALPAMLRYLRDPLGTTREAFARHGDPYTMHALGTPIVVTGDPTLIRAILAGDPDQYDAFGVAQLKPVLGGGSIMMLDGERHRAARKLQTPPFHGARLRAYAALMQQIARDEAESWRPEVPFAMQAATQAISLRVILQAVLGARPGDEAARVERMLVDLIAALRPSLLFFGALQGRWWPPWARLMRRRRAVEAWVFGEVAARRDSARQDILTLLLGARYDDGRAMDDREVLEAMMTLVVAGHETTAIALAWALWLLHRHPEVRARLEDELRGVDDPDRLASLPYLEAVCLETLRLRPIAASVVRVLRRPMTLGRYQLPAGVAVSPSMLGLHQRPELFPEPDAFRPERFLGRTFAPHELMPFGGGHRRCLGAAFAMFEMKIVLGTILQTRRLRLIDDGPVGLVPRNTVLGPARPLRFVAEAPAPSR
jgi:cytochrome P450